MTAEEIVAQEESGERVPFLGLKLKYIMEWARHARDDEYYDSRYAYQLYMAGDKDAIQSLIKTGAIDSASQENADLSIYPDVQPGVGPMGLQNHPLVNSKIFIESIVYADPEFYVDHDNWLLREFNIAWIKKRWIQGDWSNSFFQMGMETESSGISFCVLGFDATARVTLEHRPVLDMLWDRVYRHPAKWRYFFERVFMPLDEAVDIFPTISRERLEKLALPENGGQIRNENVYGRVGEECAELVVHVWRYWGRDGHACFVGGINTGNNEVVSLDENNEYTMEGIGPNPFGAIPVAWWIDAWCPGIFRPVGKAETSFRPATMLNTVEWYMRETLRRGIALNFVDAGIGDDALKKIEEADLDDLEPIIPIETLDDIRKSFMRIPPSEVPQTALLLRNSLKEELNAATGVMDAQRGQPLPGEKTALEVRSLYSSQGVQAQHARRQFAIMLRRVIWLARMMGARFERTREQFMLRQDQVYDARFFPYKSLLAADVDIYPHESSLVARSDAERRMEAAQDFKMIFEPMIAAGTAEPYKVHTLVLNKAGYRPEQILKDPALYMRELQMQQMIAMKQLAGQTSPGAPGESPDKALGPGQGEQAA